jgi:hypothetical protein
MLTSASLYLINVVGHSHSLVWWASFLFVDFQYLACQFSMISPHTSAFLTCLVRFLHTDDVRDACVKGRSSHCKAAKRCQILIYIIG